ncbi:glycine/D-amino acid oxidase-like deaminating enzyme/nitrite reductase/ring-hydroxylating ferredoxin subunit [Catalinimonas alkaloidigena]|uniref:FAD-dependent oxidoreductase n=1 Tax=Catalinimonas alkaloidigena TaxID=1075417 RepID=UPI0024057182|nr:FAD-dependent oxidoreductase [Catalinimonas alkaloidigena]MDF9797088.1 glycine/D-amino acid oxidase-like deaminating enzyme/nitrite reductase/ring-hydroxylating ferredoxin subunit [Catalinimonas alkaloidigena]
MKSTSLWKDTAQEQATYPSLEENISAEIVVVGGGITGLTAAYELVKAGKKVVVVEAFSVGDGTTGLSSCHLNTQIDYGYQHVKQSFDQEVMRLVADSRFSAINYIEKQCTQEGMSCDFKRLPGFLYAETEAQAQFLLEEYKHAQEAGLSVTLHDQIPFPSTIKKAIEYHEQAVFNSQKYVNHLAKWIYASENGQVFENTRVKDISLKNKKVLTEKGEISAHQIILATHLPLFFDVLQTMAAPYRSYILVGEVEQRDMPEGLYWDLQEPYHYTRYYHQGEKTWLAVGGADHKTGHNEQNQDSYEKLKQYMQEHFNIKNFTYQWSSQYYEPADGLPYIGLSPFKNVYVATGYSGDGLVYGTVAGLLLKDLILKQDNAWAKAYDARRFKPVASFGEWAKENMEVVTDFVKDYLGSKEKEAENIPRGEGKVISKDNIKYAVYRNEQNQFISLSPICPHLKCVVHWNTEEKSWDCPCHGSRFTPEGKLLVGPAVSDLERKDYNDK